MRNSNIPERLGLYLETSGLSQKELSKLSGVPDSVICRVIKGQSTLSEKNLIKIIDSIGVSPAWLLGYGADDQIELLKEV